MNTNTFIVTRDGQVDKSLSKLTNPTLEFIVQRREAARLQIKMFRYDLLHGTHYRSIRNQLMREQRNRAFELQIGLVKKNPPRKQYQGGRASQVRG